MDIAVIGTGNIGTTVGHALARAGHRVTFGSRHPDDEVANDEVAAAGTSAADVATAIDGAQVVVVAIPGPAVEGLATSNGELLAGKLVLDASNNMGAPVANSRQVYETLAPQARYGRVFNCLGVEVLQNPAFGAVAADMFFSCAAADRDTVEQLIQAVGLRPVFVGDDANVVDGVFRLWIALAMGQHRGRQLAFSTLQR